MAALAADSVTGHKSIPEKVAEVMARASAADRMAVIIDKTRAIRRLETDPEHRTA